jgi:signal transduction histidine kinase
VTGLHDIVSPHLTCLSASFGMIAHAVCFVDEAGIVVEVHSTQFAELDGRSVEDDGASLQSLRKCITEEQGCESAPTEIDGEAAHVSALPLHDGHGKVRGLLAMFTRAHDNVAHPMALLRHSVQLLHVQMDQPAPEATVAFQLIEGISRFTAHALGNPLTGLSLSLELLAGAKLPEGQQRLVDRCMRVTERLTAYKENLGALGGSFKSRRESVSAEQFFRAAIEAQSLSEVYNVSLEVARDVAAFQCFPPLLNDALGYLFRNATDAMPDGGSLGIKVARVDGYVRLTFWDKGPGMPEGLEEHLWRMPTPSRKHGGGFGLLLVGMIVAHIHKGRVAHAANQPNGCQFHLDLPA